MSRPEGFEYLTPSQRACHLIVEMGSVAILHFDSQELAWYRESLAPAVDEQVKALLVSGSWRTQKSGAK